LALLLFAPGKSSGKIHPGISEADEQRARELVMQMTLILHPKRASLLI